MRSIGHFTLVAGLALAALPAVAAETQRRLALVVGEAAYARAGAAPTAVEDARAAAAALKSAGWEVQPPVENADRARLTAAVAAFAGSLKPGDAAFVYYAGLSAKGPPAGAGQGVENYLLPVEADPKQPADLPRQGLALSELAAKLPASAKVLVVDAARPTMAEGAWNVGFGPAEPTNEAFVDAYVVFPAGLNRIAADGVFPPALAAELGGANASASAVFRRVSQRVTAASKASQTPWAAGGARSSSLVLHPDGSGPAGAAAADRDAYEQAVACGTRACLTQAAAQVTDRKLKLDLSVRASAASGPDVAVATGSVGAGAAVDSQSTIGMTYVEGALEQHKASPAGQSWLGQSFLNGEHGFPKDVGQAYTFLMRAASQGDGEANYLFGLSYHKPGPLSPRTYDHTDHYAAIQSFTKAADKGDPRAQYFLALYDFTDYPWRHANRDQGELLLRRAAAAGEPRAQALLADASALDRLRAGQLPADW